MSRERATSCSSRSSLRSRKIVSGIGIVDDVTWRTDVCHFYKTQEDLLDTLVA
jgi:hypothetical protein